jgi:hypothetical protein
VISGVIILLVTAQVHKAERDREAVIIGDKISVFLGSSWHSDLIHNRQLLACVPINEAAAEVATAPVNGAALKTPAG